MLSAVFAVLFGLSLLPGRKPLCLRFAEKISDGLMPVGAEHYCRQLTWVWFALLSFSAVAFLLIPYGWVFSSVVVPFTFLVEKQIRNRRFQVVFQTSGSTGKSKVITKTFENLAKEVAFHARTYRGLGSGVTFLGTIQWDHMYGTLWMKMLPRALGAQAVEEVIHTPEELLAQMSSAQKVFLVTTPSFLDRFVKYADQYEVPKNAVEIVTSGARLSLETARRTKEIFGVWPRQIYGSTETGGIASCRETETMEVFEAVRVAQKDGRLLVKSPYSFTRAYLMGDGVELSGDRRTFRLKGRVDRLVKINEERVNLAEMEGKVRALGFSEAALVVLPGLNGPSLGLVVVGEKIAPLKMREKLLGVFPKGTVPKKFRFVAEIPKNPQGKVVAGELAKMF